MKWGMMMCLMSLLFWRPNLREKAPMMWRLDLSSPVRQREIGEHVLSHFVGNAAVGKDKRTDALKAAACELQLAVVLLAKGSFDNIAIEVTR